MQPLKDRVISQIVQEQNRIKIAEPFMRNKERPSLKGRIHKLPKTAFWRRLGGWPLKTEWETL